MIIQTCSILNFASVTFSVKVRSHQTRMKRYARMIYMAIQRRDRQSCGAIHPNGTNYAARIERLTRHSRELKNLNFGGYSRRVNQSGACSSSDVITSGDRKSETTMEDKLIMLYVGSLPGAVRYYFELLQKQEYI